MHRTRGAARKEAEANAPVTPPKTNANAGTASNNFEAGPSGVNAPAAPSTMKHHHVDPEDPVHLQKIVDASYLADDTLFNEMEAGRKLAAETLAETPPPRKRKARTAEGAIEISPDSNCMSCSTNPISPGTPL